MVTEGERKLLAWALKGNADAGRLCEALLNCAQVIDDLIDGDSQPEQGELLGCFYTLLFEIPTNPFYQRHMAQIEPVMRASFNDWLDANQIELTRPNEVSFVLRDTFINVVFVCAELIGGPQWRREIAMPIRQAHHDETFTQYMEAHNDNGR